MIIDNAHVAYDAVQWHLGLFKWEYTPTFRGYDSFLGYYSGSQDYFTHRDSGFDLHLDIGPNCGQNCSQPQLQLNGNYSTHIYADRAVTILAEHPSASDPLFLYMPFRKSWLCTRSTCLE